MRAIVFLFLLGGSTAFGSPRTAIYYAYPTDIERSEIKVERKLTSPFKYRRGWSPIHESVSLAFKRFKDISTFGEDVSLVLEKIEVENNIMIIHFKESGRVEWDDVEVLSLCIQIGMGKTRAVNREDHVNSKNLKNPKVKGFRFVGGRLGRWPREGYYPVDGYGKVELDSDKSRKGTND